MASWRAISSFFSSVQTALMCCQLHKFMASWQERPLNASFWHTWWEAVYFITPLGTAEHLLSIWWTTTLRRSNSVKCFGGRMIPLAASITFGCAFDCTKTWSNSPVKSDGKVLNFSHTTVDGFGRELKIKLVDEHQKKHLHGTISFWVDSVK